ncbi:E3 ubiquitin-protein ligase RNF12-B-like [Bactrocera neohumeralis]|uniref:E3 ubiquitin-protein ligase RNF12-B-like n=1 Tax=Bactrocera tryoni TaxID=59916 RepID=UPI001A9753B4|nr:E3 ubiquitin-protein ligase RNF12-B-like [Bactrocera tryoni]XP_050318488.1 E3 ubiquitin-protein ligase RNF12-B-like [Bactrocera neohumeralis]
MAQRHAIMWLVGLLVVQIVVCQQPTITKSDGKIMLNLEYVNQPVLRFNPIYTTTFKPIFSIVAEPEPTLQPEPTPEPQSQTEAIPEPELQTEATPEPQPQPESTPEPEPTPKRKPNPKPEPESQTEEITTDTLYKLLQFFKNFV